MTLAVGDLCSVVYAQGGVRTALPVEIAGVGQNVFLSDFGTTGEGVPLRLRTIDEIMATVPEDAENPRLQRVIGTLARDGNDLPMFVPLSVLPIPGGGTGDGIRTFFIVFADTAPVDAGLGGSFPQAFFKRTPGEWDKFLKAVQVEFGGLFVEIRYGTQAYSAAHLGGGVFRDTVQATPITLLRSQNAGDEPPNGERLEIDNPIGTTIQYFVARGFVSIRGFGYIMQGNGNVVEIPEDQPYTSGRTWQVEYEYFPLVINRVRNNFDEWDELPAALVYHSPLEPDAVPGTINEILPTGVTDTAPLEIINEAPTLGGVVARLGELAGSGGIKEVRFITALASHDAVTKANALIGDIIGALNGSYGTVATSTTVAPGYDWLGALADSAAQLPDA